MPRQHQQPIQRDPQPAAVLDGLPYGIVVLDGGRRVRSANQAAVNLLWDLDRGGPPVDCHELFECRSPGGPCEQQCLAERAAAAADALPEIRIDTARRDAAVSALWVTAAPLAREEGVVLHLRPGDARDRRRRSDPHWMGGPELRISALGRTWVNSRETPIGGQWLGQRPGLMLKYLICERNRVVHAEEIAEALWPRAGNGSLGNVRHFMHALRQKLEPARGRGVASSFIITVQGGYALDRRHVRIDADEFETATREGLAAAARADDAIALERLEHAASLYRGDLVADEPYAEWAHAERDRLRALAAECLREVASLLGRRGDTPGATAVLERLAEMEPFDAGTQRAVLTAYLAQGRRSEAARRYAAYRARVAREFGEDPGFALSDLKTPRR